MLKLLAFVSALAFVVGVPVVHKQRGAVVVLHVFSSTADPSCTLSPAQVETLRSAMPVIECSDALKYPNVGYQGFTINGNRVKGCPHFERELFSACTVGLKPQVAAYVTSQLHAISAASANKPSSSFSIDAFLLPLAPALPPSAPVAPIRGPDTVPVYDPSSDLKGHFVSHQTENNCYNYANDVATDTFAQPGRGSGQKWSFDTCADINASATRDGLQWVGTEMPSQPPAVGHHVGLWMWPDTNFHWCRHDTNKLWSHKPGQTPVKDEDNDGKPITDPAKADVAPWTLFCGYFVTVPSQVNIN